MLILDIDGKFIYTQILGIQEFEKKNPRYSLYLIFCAYYFDFCMSFRYTFFSCNIIHNINVCSPNIISVL